MKHILVSAKKLVYLPQGYPSSSVVDRDLDTFLLSSLNPYDV